MESNRRTIMKEAGHRAYNGGGEDVQLRMLEVVRSLPQSDAPQYTGCMFIIGALCPLAMSFAKRNPEVFSEDNHAKLGREEAHNLAWSLVTPETLMWTALLCGMMVEKADGDNTSTQWGPSMFVGVLEAWCKLFPGKSPDDYLDASLLSAIRETERDAENPLNQFLKTRSGSLPPSTNSIN